MADKLWPSWPAWYYGPRGGAAVFEREEDVPGGWLDHPFADPLDHDGDGKKGGSPKPEQTDDLPALRKEYEQLKGKKPFSGWDAATLREKIPEARA